ncbi:MAG: hypothetical protein HYT11_04585 [Candidatus Levybacteria bacterium]|nr:hypothetical protein [Candidatus Levybacteria bacterium]
MDNSAQSAPSQSAAPSQPSAQSGHTPAQTAGKKKGFPWIFLIVIAVIFSVLAFGAMFFLSQKQKVSYAPPFPKVTPISTIAPREATSSPTAKLMPTTAATPSATPIP